MRTAAFSLPDEHNNGNAEAGNIGSECPTLGPEEETVEKTEEHETSVQVDSSLLRFIVGPGGATKAKIENDSHVVLQIPSKSTAKFASNIIVRGPTQDGVKDAVKQIEEVVEQAVKSPNYQYTHFISLPLAVHQSLVSELISFEEAILASIKGSDEDLSGDVGNGMDGEVEDEEEESGKTPMAVTQKRKHGKGGEVDLQDTNSDGVAIEEMEADQEPAKEPLISRTRQKQGKGIDKSIFIKAKTFHLTVLMLKLWNQDRLNTAADILQRTRSAVHLALEDKPVEIELNGAECMRANPAKAHVLYARVQEVGQGTRLMAACQILIDAFVTGGLVMERDQNQPLMLHATLMNTSHRKRCKGRNFRRRTPFDARQIIETYGSKQWGKYLVSEAHLSQRFLYDDDGAFGIWYHLERKV